MWKGLYKKMKVNNKMEKEGQVILNNSTFKKIEDHILKDTESIVKSLINTFKFQMIYSSRVSKKTEIKTTKAVKEYRQENNGAYKEYVKELFS